MRFIARGRGFCRRGGEKTCPAHDEHGSAGRIDRELVTDDRREPVDPSRRRRGALIGLLLVLGGLITAFFGLDDAFVTEAGRPWDISYGPVDGAISGTIVHEDGRVENFTVEDGRELEVFLERRERELTDEYGLRNREIVGQVMLFGGLASVLIGAMGLVWSWIGTVRRT